MSEAKKILRAPKAKDGQWIKPTQRGYLMACCDCGLVHRMNFSTQNGKVIFQAFRAIGATKAFRKKEGIQVKHQRRRFKQRMKYSSRRGRLSKHKIKKKNKTAPSVSLALKPLHQSLSKTQKGRRVK